jgi:PAS domain S-box-containing protein
MYFYIVQIDINICRMDMYWDTLMLFSPVAIVVYDKEMNIIDASNSWLARYSLKKNEVIGRNSYEIFPHLPEYWKGIHKKCLAGASERNDEDVLIMPDGRIEFVRWDIKPYKDAAGDVAGLMMFSEIITEAVTDRNRILRLNRISTLFNNITDAAIKSTDEFVLIEWICKEIVDTGGFQLVWFSFLPNNLKDVQLLSPLHKYGEAIHYMDSFFIDLNDELQKNGPTGIAIATGETTVANDFSTDDRYLPWRARAAAYNLRSSISIPLKLGNGQVGILGIYSNTINAFGKEDVEILERIRNVIVFAIDNSRRKYEGRVAQVNRDKLIKELNARNRSLEDFTYIVSHNLRAKISDLLGIATLVADDLITESEKNEYFSEIRNLSVKLDEIIKDLNSSLLVKEHLFLNDEFVQFSILFLRIEHNIQSKYPRFVVKGDFSEAAGVYSDSYYIYEAVCQLLTTLSAPQTSNSDREIMVKSKSENGRISLHITDKCNPITIEPGSYDLTYLYRKIYHHLSDGGIKLFYAEAIINNLGGKLLVNSNINSQVTFVIELVELNRHL